MRFGGGGGGINAKDEGDGRFTRAEEDMVGEGVDMVAHRSKYLISGEGGGMQKMQKGFRRQDKSIHKDPRTKF